MLPISHAHDSAFTELSFNLAQCCVQCFSLISVHSGLSHFANTQLIFV